MTHPEDPHAQKARELLQIDSLNLVQEATGLPYTDPRVAGLGFMLVHELADSRKAVLSELCDTYRHMPWDGFLELIGDAGFELFHTDERKDAQDRSQFDIIAADRKRKLLLQATSGRNKLRNNGDLTLSTGYFSGVVDGGPTSDGQDRAFSLVNNMMKGGGFSHAIGETHFCFWGNVEEGFLMKLGEFDNSGVDATNWLPGEEPGLLEPETLGLLPDWVREFVNQ